MPGHYSGTLKLYPNQQELSAELVLSMEATADKERMEFFLHQDLEVSHIGGVGVKGYGRQSKSYTFAPEAVTWLVDLDKNIPENRVLLEFSYGGRLHKPIPENWQVNRLSPEWIELGMYGPWFPWQPEGEPFTFEIEVHVAEPFIIVGMGERRKKNNHWLVKCEKPVQDLVITGAPEYYQIRRFSDDTSIEVHYPVKGYEDVAIALANDGLWLLDYFAGWLGRVEGDVSLSVILARRNAGGGYARPGFMVIQELDEKARQQKCFVGYLAHEIAHFWWNGARIDSWEDWLNESFAEYTALRAIKEKKGEEIFQRLIERKSKDMDKLPPIRELPRQHEKAWEVLYNKGAVLLHKLHELMGKEAFDNLLRARLQKSINTTSGFLELLAREGGEEKARIFSCWLEN